MGPNRRILGDPAPSWLVWWLFWAAVLFWPVMVWHGAAGWWASAGWIAFLGTFLIGGHALAARSRRPSFTCPVCGAVSYHPDDIASGFCGRCHGWTGRPSE